ncbi:hypothetical protein ABI59_18435 [Acidobacteria bacterium Mor1]|nr:hypothetical protein ABI59_18435 [Acidobacteria bacterium Mor1]
MSHNDDEFYVGYLPEAPAGIAAHVKRSILLILLLAAGVAGALAALQSPFDPGAFEFGIDRTFEGVLLEHPYPLLVVDDGEYPGSHLLVAFGKFGAESLTAGHDGKRVRITGSRIWNDQEQMIEVHELEPLGDARQSLAGGMELGTFSFTGEIVDSKCHLGVMKPGRGKPHKACAILCIRGGVPPVLRVESESGELSYLFLVDEQGNAVNDRVLEMIAEPVEIHGEVERRGDVLTLRADPASYKLL